MYALGGDEPIQLIKLNSSGTILWNYSVASNEFGHFYSDFAVDRTTGTSYMCEGYGGFGASRVVKVNTAGILTGVSMGDTLINELGRMAFDECNHNLILGAGGVYGSMSAVVLDTSLTSFKMVNIGGFILSGQ